MKEKYFGITKEEAEVLGLKESKIKNIFRTNKLTKEDKELIKKIYKIK